MITCFDTVHKCNRQKDGLMDRQTLRDGIGCTYA